MITIKRARLFFFIVTLAAIAPSSGRALVSPAAAPAAAGRHEAFAGQFFAGQFFEGSEQALQSRFDKNGDKKLDAAERKAALDYLGAGGIGRVSSAPVAKILPSSARAVPASTPLYDPATLRTLFLEFEDANWERELAVFKQTDILVPANLTIDGKTYRDVGVRFRGNSSFRMVGDGQKRSLSITLDAFVKDQAVLGFTALNLLNSHADPSFLHAVLFLQAARELMPAPRANYVRIVINGENWGIYPNIEQINGSFLKEWFKSESGTRWKVPGSLNGRGGLEYWGDDPGAYKQSFEIKGVDDPKAWQALINLTRVLNTTPPEKLEAALAGILDVDGALRFLALDNALVNNDGYWVRASDYAIYLDPGGKFHILIHDVNEAFGGVGGGFPMNAGPAGPDPLVGLNDPSKPLRSKLLAVPALRAKYLGYTRQIASKWLDWKSLQAIAEGYRKLISEDVRADNRKIYSFEEFVEGPSELKGFADLRRPLLLNYPER